MLRILAAIVLLAAPAAAHQVLPAIVDLGTRGDTLTLEVNLNLEGFIAGIDLSQTMDTNAAPSGASYDALRAMEPARLEQTFRGFWPQMAGRISIYADRSRLVPVLEGIHAGEVGNFDLPRTASLRLSAVLPRGTKVVRVGWAAEFGAMVIRQTGVGKPFDGYVAGGVLSPPIEVGGGDEKGRAATFLAYVPVGFDHIVPQGLDHILFVLGLFFLSSRLSPLLWQVSAFTVAHTITLALAALGYVQLPPSVVEPLIAASIVFVAVENIVSSGLSPWRPVVVFCFGLLHGLGFASVLGEFGLPPGAFVPALIGFNVGVEFGQLFVIACAFALVGYWFRRKPWYRARIAVPASVAIACVGAFWFVERVT